MAFHANVNGIFENSFEASFILSDSFAHKGEMLIQIPHPSQANIKQFPSSRHCTSISNAQISGSEKTCVCLCVGGRRELGRGREEVGTGKEMLKVPIDQRIISCFQTVRYFKDVLAAYIF